jgi:WD40 repeat protein
MIRLALFTLVIFVAAVACKEEIRNNFPDIKVFAPIGGSTFQVNDTLRLAILLLDDQGIESLEISLEGGEGGPYPAPLILNHPTLGDTLFLEFLLNEPLLESDTYDLRIKAYDGINITNAFVSLNIFAVDREFQYPVFVMQSSSSQYKIYSLPSSGQWDELFSFQGDYAGVASLSAYRLLFLCGKSQTGLVALNLEKKQVKWSVPPVHTLQERWFEAISVSGKDLFVSYYEGYIKAFDRYGGASFTTSTIAPYSPNICCMVNSNLVAGMHDYHTRQNAIGIFFTPGGTLKRMISPAITVNSISARDYNNVLVFGNDTGKGKIQILDIEEGTCSTIKEINNDSIVSVSSMDNLNYIIACRNTLYWYHESTSSLTPFAEDISLARLSCEPLNSLIYAASGNQVKIFSFPEGQVISTFDAPFPVVGMQLIYNR